MAYVKVFDSLIHSTIWAEPLPTRVVWITMLAMADRDGVVKARAPGIAKAAGVSRAEVDRALECFQRPDPDSTTKDNEGRRAAEHEDGWLILNYEKYRDRHDTDERRAKDAARQARKRERDKARESRDCHVTSRSSRSVTPSGSDASQLQTQRISTAKAAVKAEQPPPRPDVSDLAWLARTAEEITRGQIEPSALLRQGSKRRAAAESVLAAIEKAAKVRGLPARELARMALDEWLDERRARLADWIGLFADDLGATLIKLDDKERDRQAREGQAAQ